MGEKKRIALASDHAGYILKESVKEYLRDMGFDVDDQGCDSADDSVDYPDYAKAVARGVSKGEFERGILICGTGIGMSISANRFPRVRAALVTSDFHAQMAAKHNKANILVLGGKTTGFNEAKSMIKIWLSAEYEGGRHDRRIEKIEKI